MKRTKPLDVLGVGALLADQIVNVTDELISQLPGKKGGMETVEYQGMEELLRLTNSTSPLIPGGSCANVIRSLAHLGRKCALMGKIGDDKIGNSLLNNLETLGIETLYSKSSTPTGQVVSLVTPDGERTCRSYLGAHKEISPTDLIPDQFENVKFVHIEGYTLLYPGLTECAMQYAKEAGAKISFDLSSFEIVEAHKDNILKLLSQFIDICFANKLEAHLITGKTSEEGCTALKNLCPLAVVSLGKEGCFVGHKESVVHYPAYPVDHPVDTTGAGDLFAAGFLHGHLSGKSFDVCADYGALLGAAIVQVQGTVLSDAQWKLLLKRLAYKS
ncbi:MAG: adenosine kinase [Parachlamydiaceae bacterium]|nr:adenosine kinase [Parachlamydiaceae bacterium]